MTCATARKPDKTSRISGPGVATLVSRRSTCTSPSTTSDPGGRHGTSTWRRRTELHRRDHRGDDRLLRLEGRQLGGALLAPQGLHPGVLHGARSGRGAEARVRPPTYTGYTALRRRRV